MRFGPRHDPPRDAGPHDRHLYEQQSTAGSGPRGDDKMRQVIVFAYGSNLDDQQMRSRCASAQIEARAVLPNHALAFGGFSQRWGGAVASIVPEPGAHVEGLLYRITSPDL